MLQIVLIVCGFITLWVIIAGFVWYKVFKAISKDTDFDERKAEHRARMDRMRDEHDKRSREFQEEWNKRTNGR